MKNYFWNTRKIIRSSIYKATEYLQVHKLFYPYYSGIGSILMFHRIKKKYSNSKISVNSGSEVSPKYLESIINLFIKNNYDIVSIDEVYERLKDRRNNKKFICFTFDDGYVDNYYLAYPIFKKYDIPFTIYITTSFIDRKAVPWHYFLEDLFLYNDTVFFTHNNINYRFSTSSRTKEIKTFKFIESLILKADEDDYERLIEDIFKSYMLDISAYSKKLTLSWDQIKQMSDSGIVTIGAHTINHYNLNNLSYKTIKNEIEGSKNLIESYINKKVEHFAYPFGKGIKIKILQILKELNFKTAVTDKVANIFPEHLNYLYYLPRITVNGNNEDLSEIEILISGLRTALMYKFKKVIT